MLAGNVTARQMGSAGRSEAQQRPLILLRNSYGGSWVMINAKLATAQPERYGRWRSTD
jgi:hypothetical protein